MRDKVTRQCPQTTAFKEKGSARSSIFCLLVCLFLFWSLQWLFFSFFLLLSPPLPSSSWVSKNKIWAKESRKLSTLHTLKKDNYFRTHRQPHCIVESQCLQRCRPRPEPPCAGLHWRRVLTIHAWHGTGYVLLARLLDWNLSSSVE